MQPNYLAHVDPAAKAQMDQHSHPTWCRLQTHWGCTWSSSHQDCWYKFKQIWLQHWALGSLSLAANWIWFHSQWDFRPSSHQGVHPTKPQQPVSPGECHEKVCNIPCWSPLKQWVKACCGVWRTVGQSVESRKKKLSENVLFVCGLIKVETTSEQASENWSTHPISGQCKLQSDSPFLLSEERSE